MTNLAERLRQAAAASTSPRLSVLLHASAHVHAESMGLVDELRIAQARLKATRRELNLMILRSEQRIAGEWWTSPARELIDEITSVRDAIPEDGK